VSEQGPYAQQIEGPHRSISHARRGNGKHDMLPMDALLKVDLLVFQGSSDGLFS